MLTKTVVLSRQSLGPIQLFFSAAAAGDERLSELDRKLTRAQTSGLGTCELEVTDRDCLWLSMALESLGDTIENHREQPMFEFVLDCARRDHAVVKEAWAGLGAEALDAQLAARSAKKSRPVPAAPVTGKRGWLARLRG